jgi:uncharacterized OsmC-like protein
VTDRRTPTSGQPRGFLGSPDQGQSEATGKALPSSTRTVRCWTEATGRFSQKHHIRDLTPFGGGSDVEALSLLNDDTMPSPSEALLAALGSCLSVSIQANAAARAIPIRRLAIELEGDIDFAALWGTGDLDFKGLGFETISISVQIEADTPREVLQALLDHAVRWSPVANTLYNPINLDIALA